MANRGEMGGAWDLRLAEGQRPLRFALSREYPRSENPDLGHPHSLGVADWTG
jgi:hypothetical protein